MPLVVALGMHDRAHHVALDDAQDVLRIIQSEHADARHLVLAADRDRGSIHHLEVALLHLLIGGSRFRSACCLLLSFTVLRLIFRIQPELSHIHIIGFGDSIYRSPAGILPHGMGTTII